MGWQRTLAWIWVGSDGRPDNELPGSGGRPDNELPGGGGHPWLPGHGGGGRPDNELPGGGHVWGTWGKFLKWLFGPHVDNKPPGRPILPPHVDNGLPPDNAHIWWGGGHGNWEILDPGFGRPPVIGWEPIDPGFGWGGGGQGSGTLPVPPGQWVPGDPNWGIEEGECHCDHKLARWFYVFESGDLTKPAQPIAGTPQPKTTAKV